MKYPNPNNLLKCIHFDINEKVYIACCRALGIMDKIVTGPFWRLTVSSQNILTMNPELERMHSRLQQWATDASELLSVGTVMFPNVPIHEDALFTKLFEETEDPDLDAYTVMALEILCQSFLLIMERQAKDKLPGGKYFTPDTHLKEISQNVKTTNITSERDFAQLDWLVRIKPSASVLVYETVILDKTSQWLAGLPENEKNSLLDNARKNAPDLQQAFKNRQSKLKEEKLKKLHEKQLEKEA